MEELSEEHYFWVKDGRVIKNLQDLIMVLKSVDEETFYHHVDTEKNDFANWVSDTLEDTYLANQMKRLAFSRGYVLLGGWYHRKAMILLVKKRVKELKKIEKRISMSFENNPDPLFTTVKYDFKNSFNTVTTYAKKIMSDLVIFMKKP